MEVYELTDRGRMLSHSRRSPRTPEWGVIHHLAKNGIATREQLMEYVPDATGTTLAKFQAVHIIHGRVRCSP